jgi:hypothetical protein
MKQKRGGRISSRVYIHTAAEEVLGMSRSKRRNGWFDVECQKAVNMKQE